MGERVEERPTLYGLIGKAILNLCTQKFSAAVAVRPNSVDPYSFA
jgi:hypothetical protein